MIAYLYGISEQQAEEFVTLNLAAKYFVGLGVDKQAPDHSTLTYLKDRITKDVGIVGYEAILNEMLRIAVKKGITFGSIQIVDSVATIANVNIGKDDRRQGKEDKPPRIPDAAWGVKKVKKVKQADGTRKEMKESFYGYKSHISHNGETGLILEGGTAYTGDKAYDDGENHEFLEARNLQSAIILNDNRTTTKQTENNQPWHAFKQRPIYQEAKSSRYKVEQPFGTAKVYHGFSRCRYLGKTKMAVQAYLTFMALNLKRFMVLTVGVPFRNGLAYATVPGGG